MLVGLLCMVIGIIVGGAGISYGSKKHRLAATYKQRWQGAVQLLQDQGKVTDTQMKQLLGETNGGNSLEVSQQQLRQMADPYRADVAIDRAKQGLPPNDDLVGMGSVYAADVLQARTKYQRKQRKK